MLRRFARKCVRAIAVAAVFGAIAGCLAINLTGHDPTRWHVDPAEIALRGTPNEFLAAVPGTTRATPDLLTAARPGSGRALLGCFDRIASAQPRVEVVAGDVEGLMITYVQRSRLVGFPDYITVKAVEIKTGAPEASAALIIYSRSRYGRGDLGVNQARVMDWLKESGAAC